MAGRAPSREPSGARQIRTMAPELRGSGLGAIVSSLTMVVIVCPSRGLHGQGPSYDQTRDHPSDLPAHATRTKG
jgi:hypothetical protein